MSPILYFSGNVGSLTREQRIQRKSGLKHRCLSYAYMGPVRRDQIDIFDYCLKSGVKVFLDSGAFTLQQDASCDWRAAKAYMATYLGFLREYVNQLDVCVTVDWRRDGKIVREATRWFQDQSMEVMPVYHGETSIDNLVELCDLGYKWIGVSKADSATQIQLQRFYSRVFYYAEKYNVKIHGLSETSLNMIRHPFYSVDSTTWLQDSGRGLILQVDRLRRKLIRIYISDDHRRGKFEHWKSFTPDYRQKIREQMEAWGFDEEGIRADHLERTAFNARVFVELLKDPIVMEESRKWTPITL